MLREERSDMHRIIIAALLIGAPACESTYHPEYHPVTVTTVHQAWNAPGVTAVVAQPASVSTVSVVPVGVSPQPIVVTQPSLANPDVFFQR